MRLIKSFQIYHSSRYPRRHRLEQSETRRVSGKYSVNGQEETSDSGAESSTQAAEHHVLFATTRILTIVWTCETYI